jgi:hypothetical protein
MSTNDTYLAVFLGSKTSARMKTWMALPEAERRAKEHEGIAAWKAWLEKHHAAVSVMGGPPGKTKKVTESGVADDLLARPFPAGERIAEMADVRMRAVRVKFGDA